MISPALAARRYVLIQIFTWLPIGLQLAVSVLLMNARGLNVADIGVLFAVHGLVVAALELPTGGLADVLGRRVLLLAGSGLALTAAVAGTLATGFRGFFVLIVLKAVARALLSGPAEAWYVDTVHAADPHAGIRDGLAAGQSAGGAAIAAGAVIGGLTALFVPQDGALSPIVIPMALSVPLYGALIMLSARLVVEPPRPGPAPRPVEVLRDVPATILRCSRVIRHDPGLARVLAPSIVIGMALNGVELLSPGVFKAAAGGGPLADSAYGFASTLGFGAVAVGAAGTRLAVRLLRRPWLVAVGAISVAGVAIAGFSLVNGPPGWADLTRAGVCYGTVYLALGVLGPVRSELLHLRVSGSERASLMSVDSLLLQGGGAITGFVLPSVIGHWGLAGAWLCLGAVLTVSSLLCVGLTRPAATGRPPPRPPVSGDPPVDPVRVRGR